MKIPARILIPATAAAGILGSGCVAIPMGTETFRTEYPSYVHATSDPPKQTIDVVPTVVDGDMYHRTANIGLTGTITSEQKQEQRYKAVSVKKQKRLAVGLFPTAAQTKWDRTKGSLTPVNSTLSYVGNGNYSSSGGSYEGASAQRLGTALTSLTLGFVATPISMVAGIFGPYEKDLHYLGSEVVDRSSSSYQEGNLHVTSTSTVHDSKDIDLLCKFPMSDRELIGAWTYHENAMHPHNTFWHGFYAQWVGVHKYCKFFVTDEGEIKRTNPVEPKITKTTRTVPGPYSVLLSLPGIGIQQMADVNAGETTAFFNLVDAANGDSFANGTVRFLPPPGGLAAIRNEDDCKLLELAMEKEWPVTVALPAPRIGTVPQHRSENATSKSPAPRTAPYQISSIEPKDGMLVVRVTVNDASQTFDIDRTVQPEVRRMFREQFATGPDAKHRESVRMAVEDGGKSLVYTVTFE